ncbi:MAG TPA: DUF1993 family protein, partial [Gallionella sp.]|nr:DUF1993 family protein [Gallionella sp.]
MPISMYQASVPPVLRALTNLRAILEKAAAHAEARKIDPQVLVNARLYPDMFPLVRQVQIATDNAKGLASRLTGMEPPKYEDSETTLPELLARIDKTIAFIDIFKPEQFDGAENKTISLTLHGGTHTFTGVRYLFEY